MKKIFLSLIALALLATCTQESKQKLNIATAANMQFAMKELVQSFTLDTGIECEIIIGSSGKLTAQIHQGAPFDILVSADMKYPTKLYKEGLALEKPQIYAYGTLVLWTMKEAINLPVFSDCIPLLTSDAVKHLAVANPKTAPYGRASMEILDHYNLFERVEHKLVYGESIAQTNQFITTQAADLGFTSKSVVLHSGLQNQGKWIEIPIDLYTPISQGIILVKHAESRLSQAQKFRDFLFSPKGKEILNNFGYVVTF